MRLYVPIQDVYLNKNETKSLRLASLLFIWSGGWWLWWVYNCIFCVSDSPIVSPGLPGLWRVIEYPAWPRTKRSANHRPAIPAPANHRPASRHQPSNWEINLPRRARAGQAWIIESRVRVSGPVLRSSYKQENIHSGLWPAIHCALYPDMSVRKKWFLRL